MKRQKFNPSGHSLLQALILTALIAVFSAIIPAAAVYATKTEARRHVYDEAGLFSEVELESLEEKCISYGKDANVEIVILTHNDPKAIYAEEYVEDFEEQLPARDRVYLLIDMYNRDVFIEGYGKAEAYVNSKRIDNILDEIVPDLTDGYYYDACLSFIEMAASYMKDGSELNYDHNYNIPPQSSKPNKPYYDETWPSGKYTQGTTHTVLMILSNVWVQLLISLIIGATVVAIMAYNSGGKMTAGSSNYLDHSRSGLIGRRDDYIRTTVTKVRRPKNDSNTRSGHSRGGFNSSGFRGGVSSGGRSHSSGGRKF